MAVQTENENSFGKRAERLGKGLVTIGLVALAIGFIFG
jgi:hypothetical protein